GAVIVGPAALVTIFENDVPAEGNMRAMSLGAAAESVQPVVSDDGMFAAFTTYADNLVGNDFNHDGDVLVWDRFGRSNILVSIDWTGSISGNGFSGFPSVSANGRYVAFESEASDLIVNDDNNERDVFVRDIVARTTTLISARPNGAAANGRSHSPV